MIRNKREQIVFILVFVLVAFVFGQDKPDEQDKQLREEILAVYKSGGEQGLRGFVKKQKDKISNKFIVDFAESGVNERKEGWLRMCEMMAGEKKDEKTLADVLYETGRYFRLISENKKALEFFDKALPTYIKTNNLVGQGKVYINKGAICLDSGDNVGSLKFYNKALSIFEKKGYLLGQGDAYRGIGDMYLHTSNLPSALKMYKKAFPFFEKSADYLGQGNISVREGLIYFYNGDNENALKMYDKALIFLDKAGDSLGLGNAYYCKSEVYLTTGNYQSAIEMHDKALSFFEKVKDTIGQGNVYWRKGEIYFRKGKNSMALRMHDKSLIFFKRAGDLLGQGNVLWQKGVIYLNTGDSGKALEMYDKALIFFEKVGGTLGQGNVYRSKGNIYFKASDYSKAFEMYDKALLFYDRSKCPIGLGNVYRNKGNIYFYAGDNTKAFEMYKRALPLFEKAGDPLGQGNVYLDKGNICLRTNENLKALKLYEKALFFYEKGGALVGQSNVYRSKGNIYFNSGDNPKAFKMYEKAMTIYEKIGELHGQGNVCLCKGDIYFKIGDYSKTLKMYEKALTFYKKIGDVESKSYARHGIAKVLARQGKKVEALALFEEGIFDHEKVRTQISFSEMKQTFMKKVYNQYEETVLFMLENNYYNKGFKYAEAMRGRVFTDQMIEGLVRLDKGLAPDVKEKRDNLVTKLSLLNKEINKTSVGNDEQKLIGLKKKYQKIENEFDELLIKIRLENPLYASVRYPQPVTVDEFQKETLKKDEILLRYIILSDKLYAFLISKANSIIIPLAIRGKEIKNTIKRYLESISENNSRGIRRYGKILYGKLFKPLETEIKTYKDVIIIPDGELAKIPFESLIIDKKKSGRPVFLLEKYRIRYVQSASLLSILRKHYRRDSQTRSFIGFGDPVYDYENFKQGKPEQGTPTPVRGDEITGIHRGKYAREGGKLARLTGSGEEVETIAQLFKNTNQTSVVHLRAAATEENAGAADMKNFDYIHFSCHGILGDTFQCLVLSQVPGAKEDGYFTLNEIMNCDYNAKLVVLSACRTGTGKMERAEGVMGLTRAVMYAGTPAVVASLWDVDDTATKELMIHFYKNMLEKNMDKVEALRQAKLDLINGENYASPYFWSAFIMYGE